jgi:CheY-like chemotaxis protein
MVPTYGITTVLFIDENPKNVHTWSTGLQQCSSNYSILVAPTGRAAIDLCRYQKVDCVVLDLEDNTSGFEVLFNLIPDRAHPQLAIIVFTLFAHRDLHDLARHNGAQTCLIKEQTSPHALDRAIQEAVASVASMR